MSETMQTLVLSAHILIGILLVALILIQRGKGSDTGMAFGGGASDTVFGSAGSGNFLTKTTKWLAITFFSTSLALGYAHNNAPAPTSILDTVEEVQQEGELLPFAAPLPGEQESVPALEIPGDGALTIVPEDANLADEPVVEVDKPEG